MSKHKLEVEQQKKKNIYDKIFSIYPNSVCSDARSFFSFRLLSLHILDFSLLIYESFVCMCMGVGSPCDIICSWKNEKRIYCKFVFSLIPFFFFPPNSRINFLFIFFSSSMISRDERRWAKHCGERTHRVVVVVVVSIWKGKQKRILGEFDDTEKKRPKIEWGKEGKR